MHNRVHVGYERHIEMAEALRESGLGESADRLGYLQRLAEEDPDEGLIGRASLRQLTSFLMDERELGQPEIGVSPGGVALAQWRVMGGGVLAMEFLGSGLVRFVATLDPTRDGQGSRRVSGTLPKAEMLQAVRPFFAST